MKGVIKPETSDTVIQIWEVICAIYKWLLILSNDNDDDDNSNDNKNSNALIICIYIIIITIKWCLNRCNKIENEQYNLVKDLIKSI